MPYLHVKLKRNIVKVNVSFIVKSVTQTIQRVAVMLISFISKRDQSSLAVGLERTIECVWIEADGRQIRERVQLSRVIPGWTLCVNTRPV